MRPQILFPLFASVRTLDGVGPRVAALLQKLGCERLVDLIWHLPSSVIDRRFSPKVAEAPEHAVVTLEVDVLEHRKPRASRQPYRVCTADETGALDLVFFRHHGDYLAKTLPVGQRRLVSGRVEHYGDRIQMVHPDFIARPEERAEIAAIEPVYGLTAGLSPKSLGKAVAGALARLPDLPEWQDPAWLNKNGWSDWRSCVLALHRPDGPEAVAADQPARQRLAYDELLANQLTLALLRRQLRVRKGRSVRGDGSLRQRLTSALPFELTGAQRRAIAEISDDMAAPERMVRLLQGDVGSGKTVVALFAMLAAAEAGLQSALMAPTEILAQQHFKTIEPLAEAVGVRAALLTGRVQGKARETLMGALAAGEIKLLIGTHALVQQGVEFADLGLAVIDEQHRFGVHQRLTLGAKGRAADMLVMTATPIPRTLTMTAYGDMDVSRLDEKPAGRKPIETRVIPLSRLGEVVDALRRAVDSGAQGYWICPLVEESEVVDAAAAEDRFAALKMVFGDRVSLVHGRMTGEQKDQAMQAFAAGDTRVLVATTVIEVGVDVPNATIMVIEHAERFGLAQLHQLRGRVGRGGKDSSCLLLYSADAGETARRRLRVLRTTDDGFEIAEEDLRLRGGGELLGTRQSGLPSFRLADLGVHGDLLAVARDDARLILAKDPELDSARGQALRTLLYLFERDAAIGLLRSG
ncbi:MAG: ATP-dependent DNA helicase RecG [Alphaproteobacteria bacterium]|nr:ATP-dependent DNA helicase RecG [Alphaproteobacteria bacterium]